MPKLSVKKEKEMLRKAGRGVTQLPFSTDWNEENDAEHLKSLIGEMRILSSLSRQLELSPLWEVHSGSGIHAILARLQLVSTMVRKQRLSTLDQARTLISSCKDWQKISPVDRSDFLEMLQTGNESILQRLLVQVK